MPKNNRRPLTGQTAKQKIKFDFYPYPTALNAVDMSELSRRVFGFILRLWNDGKRFEFGTRKISDILHVTRQRVIRSLDELRNLEIVEAQRLSAGYSKPSEPGEEAVPKRGERLRYVPGKRWREILKEEERRQSEQEKRSHQRSTFDGESGPSVIESGPSVTKSGHTSGPYTEVDLDRRIEKKDSAGGGSSQFASLWKTIGGHLIRLGLDGNSVSPKLKGKIIDDANTFGGPDRFAGHLNAAIVAGSTSYEDAISRARKKIWGDAKPSRQSEEGGLAPRERKMKVV